MLIPVAFKPLPDQPTYATPPFFAGQDDDKLFVSDRQSLFTLRESLFERVVDSLNVFLVYQIDSMLLLGTDNGLQQLINGRVKKIVTGHHIDHQMITDFHLDADGNILVGTLGHGLWIFPTGNLNHHPSPVTF